MTKTAGRTIAKAEPRTPSAAPKPAPGETVTPEEQAAAGRLRDAMRAGLRAPSVTVSQPKGAATMTTRLKGEALGHVRLCATMATASPAFAEWALSELSDGMLSKRDCPETAQREINAALGVLHDMKAGDPLEAMLIAQMAACHHQAMRGLGRMRGVQTLDQLRANEKAANAFMRTFTAQLEALKRYRSKGEQTVRVERVYVADGGQAIVGAVHASGGPGGGSKMPDQSHATADNA
jgi:hypothetical protein